MAECSSISSLLSSKDFASEYLEGTGDSDGSDVSEAENRTIYQRNEAARGATDQIEIQLPEEKCRRHGNKTVEMYCEDHALVGCIVCMLDPSHNNCIKRFIPELPEKSDREVTELVHELRKLRNELTLTRDETRRDISRLSQEKDGILHDISVYRDRIVSHIEELVANAKDRVEREYKLQEYRIRDIIQNTERKPTELENNIDKLDSVYSNKSQLIVDHVNGSRIRRNADELVTELEKTPMLKTMKFRVNHQLLSACTKSTPFGFFRCEFITRKKLHAKSCKNVCNFIGCCTFSDGSFVLADKNNQVLMKVGRQMQILSKINLSNEPGGICNVGRRQIAVTLPSRMRVVFMNDRLVHEYGFAVGLFCYAIQYHRGKLYIVCRSTSADEIRIYNKVGVYQSTIRKTLQPMNMPGVDGTSPVAGTLRTVNGLASDGKYLYAASSSGVLLQLDSRHKIVSIKVDEKLQGVSGICCHRSRVYVSNKVKSRVVAVDKVSNEIETIVTDDQGTNIPSAVCFNATTAKLLVLLTYSNDILQFESVTLEL